MKRILACAFALVAATAAPAASQAQRPGPAAESYAAGAHRPGPAAATPTAGHGQPATAPRQLAARAAPIDTLVLRAHTFFLSHDLLEGRGTGSRGERLAAAYIVSQLERMGIAGAGPDGDYRQPVPLREAVIDHDATRVTARRDAAGAAEATFRSGAHFIVDAGGAAAFRDFGGPAVFAGTAGLAAAALADAGPLDGRVIVVLGTLGAERMTLVPDWIRRGAAGVILLVPDAEQFAAFARARGESRLYIDAPVDDPVWQPALPSLVAGPALSAAILADAPLAPDALDGRRPFRALPLDRSVNATIRVHARPLPAANIAALLPGRHPTARHEVVAFTAHYDHLGIDSPDPRGDSIYNGFSDNAAGVAMLLAIAESIRHAPPDRSVLFLFLTGEERGLLGSTFYATRPLIPLERTAAVINLDAGAPPAPPRTWRIAGGDRSSLGDLAARVTAANGWSAEPSAAAPNSDHWPFLQRGVPAVFLIPGREWDGLSRAQQEALHQRWDRYHQPGDEWAPDFPFAGLLRYAEIARDLGLAAAGARDRPRMLR